MYRNRTSAEFEVGGNTNGMDFGFKGFSLIGSKYHTNCSIACQSTSVCKVFQSLASSSIISQ